MLHISIITSPTNWYSYRWVRERQKFFLWSVSEFRPLRGGGGSRKSANWSLKGLNCLGLVFVLIGWALGLGLRSFSSFIFTLRDTNDTNSLHYRSFEESLVGTDSIWTRFVCVLEKSTFLIFWQKLGGPLTRGGGGGQPFSGRNSLTDHKKNFWRSLSWNISEVISAWTQYKCI